MVEMEASPQEMANPQGMTVFAVENIGFLKIPCHFLLCIKYSRRHSHLWRIGRLSGVRSSGRHREGLCASGLRSPELSARVRQPNSST